MPETKQAIEVPKTVTDPISKRQVINLQALEPEVRKKVTGLTAQLNEAMQKFGMSTLEIGRVLSDIKILLEPRKVWVAYINAVPGFSKNTAYRYIEAYEIAQQRLPKSCLDLVLASGLPMIGNKDNPYGRYTQTVKALPPPKGATTEQAAQWLSKVQAKYSDQRGKSRAKLPSADELQKAAFRAIVQRYEKVPEKVETTWLRDLFCYVMESAGVEGQWTLQAKAIPKAFAQQKEEEETGAEKEK